MRKIALLVLILLLAQLVIPATQAASPRKSVAKGVQHYQKDEFEQALTEFLAAMDKSTERPEIRYDIGAALYKLQQYPQAAEALVKAANAKDPKLASNAWFNLGNALFNAQKLDEAVSAYKQALRLNHKDEDAKHNLELALRMKQIQQQGQSSADSTRQQQPSDPRQQQKQEQPAQKPQPQQAQAQADSTKMDSTANQSDIQRGPMSREEAQKLLQAMEKDEQDAQKEKIRRMMGEPKRTEKDW